MKKTLNMWESNLNWLKQSNVLWWWWDVSGGDGGAGAGAGHYYGGMHWQQNERKGFMGSGKSPNDSEISSEGLSKWKYFPNLWTFRWWKTWDEMRIEPIWMWKCFQNLVLGLMILFDVWLFDLDWVSGLWLDLDQFDCAENQISDIVNSEFGFQHKIFPWGKPQKT